MLKKKRVTISEIAKLAGVSTATVSRFINGHYEKMALETREKIQKVIDETGYHINRQAQSLKIQSTHLIGVVVADIENIFSSILFKGADEVFETSGYQILLMNSDNSLAREHEQLQRLLDLQVDGIILQPMSEKASDYAYLKANDTPVVIVDRKIIPQTWPEVTTDNYAYSKVLAQLMIRMGYARILVVSEPLAENAVRMDRYRAVKDAAIGTDTQVTHLELKNGLTKELLYSKLMTETDNFAVKTAIYCLKGTVLMQVRTLLAEFHITIPTDIGLTAFDDWNVAELMQPQITTIQQQPKLMGQRAAEVLTQAFTGKTDVPQVIQVESQLMVRHSLMADD